MKIRILLLSLICAAVTVPAIQAADAPETELGDKMDKMGGAFRKLKRQLADATKNEDSLKLVATMRESAKAALTLEPAMKADIPKADQAKFVADYQAKMKSFNAELVKLEDALKAGKNEDAAKIVEGLGTMQKEGHKQFKKPDTKKK